MTKPIIEGSQWITYYLSESLMSDDLIFQMATAAKKYENNAKQTQEGELFTGLLRNRRFLQDGCILDSRWGKMNNGLRSAHQK